MKACTHDSHAHYDRLIGPLREKARELGYALGVHGTLVRDIDLIACPWTSDAVDGRTLAEALLAVAAEHNSGLAFLKPIEDNGYFWAGTPGYKPHGRLCWTFHLGGGPYIDLSVMPKGQDLDGEQIVKAREQAEARGAMMGFVQGKAVRGGVPAAMAEYERAMAEEAIPEMLEESRERARLAQEARGRTL